MEINLHINTQYLVEAAASTNRTFEKLLPEVK